MVGGWARSHSLVPHPPVSPVVVRVLRTEIIAMPCNIRLPSADWQLHWVGL